MSAVLAGRRHPVPRDVYAIGFNTTDLTHKILRQRWPGACNPDRAPVRPKRFALPQVASAPVISPPVRSDAPARTPAQGESSGAFGEMLEASSAAPDAGDGKPASAKSKESSLPAAPEDQIADLVQTANASIQPVVAIDLALLAPELSVRGQRGRSGGRYGNGRRRADRQRRCQCGRHQHPSQRRRGEREHRSESCRNRADRGPRPAPCPRRPTGTSSRRCCSNFFKRSDALYRRALQERTGGISGPGPGG